MERHEGDRGQALGVASSPTSAPHFRRVKAGTSIGTLTKPPITRFDLTRYAVASGDFNPSHVDEVRAREEGMDGVFAHGMIGTGYMGQLVTDWLGDGFFSSMTVRSTHLVRPGDVLTVDGEVRSRRVEGGRGVIELDLTCRNQDDQQTHTGTVIVVLPIAAAKAPASAHDARIEWRVIG